MKCSTIGNDAIPYKQVTGWYDLPGYKPAGGRVIKPPGECRSPSRQSLLGGANLRHHDGCLQCRWDKALEKFALFIIALALLPMAIEALFAMVISVGFALLILLVIFLIFVFTKEVSIIVFAIALMVIAFYVFRRLMEKYKLFDTGLKFAFSGCIFIFYLSITAAMTLFAIYSTFALVAVVWNGQASETFVKDLTLFLLMTVFSISTTMGCASVVLNMLKGVRNFYKGEA
jgi:hypothetical protein